MLEKTLSPPPDAPLPPRPMSFVFFTPTLYIRRGAELALSLAGGLDDWSSQRAEVITNAVCALFLMSRAPAAARERLKEGGKVTQFLANLSKHGTEVQKKVGTLTGDLFLREMARRIFLTGVFGNGGVGVR